MQTLQLHECPRCPSGRFSRDMDHGELRQHLAMVHNLVLRHTCTIARGAICAMEIAARRSHQQEDSMSFIPSARLTAACSSSTIGPDGMLSEIICGHPATWLLREVGNGDGALTACVGHLGDAQKLFWSNADSSLGGLRIVSLYELMADLVALGNIAVDPNSPGIHDPLTNGQVASAQIAEVSHA